jgi:hypothetical protein
VPRTREDHDRERRRQRARLKALRERVAVVTALSFAALLGLAGQHAASARHRSIVLRQTAGTTPSTTRFFDQADSSFAFDEPVGREGRTAQKARTQSPVPASTPPPPPVAVTSVS